MENTHTIWKFGIQFLAHENHYSNIPSDITLYEGPINRIPDTILNTVVEIHPEFEKYNEVAMATLYKRYKGSKRKQSNGTESPLNAIESLKTPLEEHHTHIVIWVIDESWRETINHHIKVKSEIVFP